MTRLLPDEQKPRINVEELAKLDPGQRVVIGEVDCRDLGSVAVASLVGSKTSVGFDVRMLGRALGFTLDIVQTNTRNKAGELLSMRWEVLRRVDNA